MYSLAAAVVLGASSAYAATYPDGVQAQGTMGVTNPTAPVMNTPLNQTSESRLLTLNSVDDFCLYAPPSPQEIGNSEAIEVAWCTKPRNNARLIPDGVITGVSFIKSDFYVQIVGYGDFTKINLLAGDFGGELDPHGATGDGNPVGGNVTTNVVGEDLNVAEWMQYISDSQFCIRACTNANGTFSAAAMCEHRLDVMGCEFVMPGNYQVNGTFESCEADVAYPPGWYPTATGADGQPQFSTFAQYFTGVYTANGTPVSYTVGDLVTPTAPAMIPTSSNCVTTSSIANGILSLDNAGNTVTSGAPAATGSGSATPSGKSTGKTSAGSKSTGSAGATSTDAESAALPRLIPGASALVGMALASVFAAAGGAVVLL